MFQAAIYPVEDDGRSYRGSRPRPASKAHTQRDQYDPSPTQIGQDPRRRDRRPLPYRPLHPLPCHPEAYRMTPARVLPYLPGQVQKLTRFVTIRSFDSGKAHRSKIESVAAKCLQGILAQESIKIILMRSRWLRQHVYIVQRDGKVCDGQGQRSDLIVRDLQRSPGPRQSEYRCWPC